MLKKLFSVFAVLLLLTGCGGKKIPGCDVLR